MLADTSSPSIPSESMPPTGAASAQAGLRAAVRATVESLQGAMLGQHGDAKQRSARAMLAGLRHATGQTADRHPLEFERILSSLVIPLRDEEVGKGNAASRSEQAVFDALTLFATHAQSATEPIHTEQRSFAAAVGLLIKGSSSQSLKPRFDALLAARTHRARLTHLRSLITLLRGSRIPFDYGQLAVDLRTLSGPHRQAVLLRWARDVALGPSREKPDSPAASPSSSTSDSPTS